MLLIHHLKRLTSPAVHHSKTSLDFNSWQILILPPEKGVSNGIKYVFKYVKAGVAARGHNVTNVSSASSMLKEQSGSIIGGRTIPAEGRWMVKVVPIPCCDLKVIVPPWRVMIE